MKGEWAAAPTARALHTMNRKTLWITALLLLTVILAACSGGEEKQGVGLQAAGGRTDPTATPVPAMNPDADANAGAPAGDAPTGRLLLLRGGTFELYDLATGESTVLDSPHAYSPAFFNADGSYASFSVFPNFGVLDLPNETITVVENRASNPNGFGVSPDGNWLLTLTGQLTLRLQVLAVDGSATHNVAASGQVFIGSVWTLDSKLIWWLAAEEPEYQIFDPLTGESTPLGDADPEVVPPAVMSPDGTRGVDVPIAFRPNDIDANPDACFDSYIALHEPPFTFANSNQAGETVWTQPGLVASSPQWLDDNRLLFVKWGIGDCGEVQGEAERMIMIYDISTPAAQPEAVAGPIGNADDANDRPQRFGKAMGHLYSPSPDGRYIAWISGGVDAQVSEVNITDLVTGETQVILRTTRAEAGDAGEYIEDFMFRQVVWLE